MLDQTELGNQDKRFCSATSYFVIDENDRLIGATSLRHYLTVEEAKKKKIYKVLMGAHKSNKGSCKVIENCNGIFENEVTDPDNINETINRYWIDNK